MSRDLSPDTVANLLQPGRNCWTSNEKVERCGLLIDGRDYFRAFHKAASQAQRYLLIAGWRFDSGIRLLRGGDGDVRFLEFLQRLCREKHHLRIYILAWNFSVNYAHEWEADQQAKFEEGSQGKILFRYDSEHPLGGSHHQKLVVVDGQAAFVGGMDFSPGTWDDCDHTPDHPDRVDPPQEPHSPYHDVQAYLEGPVASELAKFFTLRWRTATGEKLVLENGTPLPKVPDLSLELPPSTVALSVNRHATTNDPQAVKQCLLLMQDAIRSSRHLIYLENQYFSSEDVLEALVERMKGPGGSKLDVVLILARDFHSGVEAVAMGPPQLTALEALRAAANQYGHRLGMYWSSQRGKNGEDIPIYIHSKVLVVDDRFLTIGSTNTSNRSMGVDTELNVAWEAAGPGEKSLMEGILAARVRLLSEHCGYLDQPEAQGPLHALEGLVPILNQLALSQTSRLRVFNPETMLEISPWLKGLERLGIHFDPRKSLVESL